MLTAALLRRADCAVLREGGELRMWFSAAGLTAERLAAMPDLNYEAWAKKHGIKFEPLYGTPLHLRGATVADAGIVPLGSLGVIRPEEVGRPEFTIEGWIERVAAGRED